MSKEILSPDPELRVVFSDPVYDLRVITNDDELTAAYNLLKYENSHAQDEAEEDPSDFVITNVFHAAQLIDETTSSAVFGMHVDRSTQDVLRVTVPSNAALNNLRSSMTATTGIHDGTFVDSSLGKIPPLQIAAHLMRGEIPMSSGDDGSYYVAHDNFFHRVGYQRMCQPIFDRYVSAVSTAMHSGNEAWATEIIGSFDLLSGRLANTVHDDSLAEQLAMYHYRHLFHPLAAGILAAVDAKAQIETNKKLERLNVLRETFAAKVESGDNLDERIDNLIDLKDVVLDGLIDQGLPPERVLIRRASYKGKADPTKTVTGWILYEDIDVHEADYDRNGNLKKPEERHATGCLFDEYGGITNYRARFITPDFPGLEKSEQAQENPDALVLLGEGVVPERRLMSSTYVQTSFAQDLAHLVVRTGVELLGDKSE